MSKFDDYFSEPRYFSNDAYVMSGKLSREAAAEQLSEYLNEEIAPESLEEERVRYGYAPEEVIDMGSELCWHTGASGKGSLPVWVYG
jgi:hypothetical protein